MDSSLTSLNHQQHHPLLNTQSPLKNYHQSPFLKPISLFSKPKTFKPITILVTKETSFHQTSKHPQNPNVINSAFTFLKTTCIAFITTVMLVSAPRLAVAAPVIAPQVEKAELTDEDREKFLEEYLEMNKEDVKALRSLMEIKLKLQKFNEAIEIIDKVIEIEPNDKEWVLIKSHLYSSNGEMELAKKGFEEVLKEDPLVVEAYHGLVMATAQLSEEGNVVEGELDSVKKRIEEAMEKCGKTDNKEMLRDFKLLVAQVGVVEGNYTEALEIYKELVKEEPMDFRPYLCQGIIYMLLKKKDEAEIQFEKYRRLVPKDHPYAKFFDDGTFEKRMFSHTGMKEGMNLSC